jgi:long-chain acyl-CoA synthetase
MLAAAAGLLVAAYLAFAAVRIGLHQRLPLALGPISLDAIPDRAAARHGDRTIFTTDTPVRWEVPALAQRYPDPCAWSALRIRATAGQVAALLRDQLGVSRGDAVAILKENHLDMHVLYAAVVRAGGVACAINGRFDAQGVQPYLANLGCRVLISDTSTLLRIIADGGRIAGVGTIVIAGRRGVDEDAERALAEACPGTRILWIEEGLAQVRAECGPAARTGDDEMYRVHSSGTTGFPKAVMLKNGAQAHAVRGWLCYVHISRSRDKGLLAVPNNHQAVILTFNSLLLLGARMHWMAAYDRAGFDAPAVISELARGRYTGFFGFPITYTQMKEVPLERHDLTRMRFWGSTADASHEVIQRRFAQVGGLFRELGIPIAGSAFLDAQGSSEVGTPSVLRYVTSVTRRFDRRIGRPGSTPFGPRVRITRPDGTRARGSDVGRLEVKGKTVFPGYWGQPALTLAAFRDGWFFTGDVARYAPDGHIVQLDREVDVIHTSDGPVYSLPIEETIHKHPAVFDVCVYGARQQDGTQAPAAAIALRPGFDVSAESLRDELNAHLAPADRLRHLAIMAWADFPVGITGKTLKRVFRERSEATLAGSEKTHQPGSTW